MGDSFSGRGAGSSRLSIGLDTSALDPTFKAHANRGIGRYVGELSKRILGTKGDAVTVESFDYRTFLLPRMLERGLAGLPLGRQTIRQQILYPLQLGGRKLAGFDAVHFPAHMDAPTWSPKPFIITVLDLIPLIFRDLYEAERPGWRFKLARALEIRSIRSARLVLAISECTARDVESMLGIPRERIVVTPLGVDERFFRDVAPHATRLLLERLGITDERPNILYVGGIDQRKNVEGMLETFSRIVARRRGSGLPLPRLIVAGRIAGDRQYPKFRAALSRFGVDTHVLETGYLEDADLLALYRGVSVFLFLSLYEGFGLPPLEAMAAGVPVVSSNASSMPEVLGDAALLVPPSDYDRAARAVCSVLESPELAQDLAHRGRKMARSFTWERTADLTLEAYERFRVAA